MKRACSWFQFIQNHDKIFTSERKSIQFSCGNYFLSRATSMEGRAYASCFSQTICVNSSFLIIHLDIIKFPAWSKLFSKKWRSKSILTAFFFCFALWAFLMWSRFSLESEISATARVLRYWRSHFFCSAGSGFPEGGPSCRSRSRSIRITFIKIFCSLCGIFRQGVHQCWPSPKHKAWLFVLFETRIDNITPNLNNPLTPRYKSVLIQKWHLESQKSIWFLKTGDV